MLARIRTLIAELGLLPAGLYALDRAFRRLRLPIRVYAYDLVAQPVPDQPLLSRPSARPLALREINRLDPALGEMPLTPTVVDFRFRQGATCLGLFDEGRLIGYLWFCFGAYEEDEVRCRYLIRPAESTAWDFDVYLPPDRRAGFGFVRLWDSANAWLRARGRHWSISRISAFNRASLASHRRLGTRRLGRAVFVRIGPLQLLLSDRRPWLHLSLGARPTIELEAPAAGAADSQFP